MTFIKMPSVIKKELQSLKESSPVLWSLVHKDLIGRYKNSIFGFSWHFIMPVILLSVYYVVFSSGIRLLPIDNFIIYLSSSLFIFTFMTSCLSNGSSSITSHSDIMKKVFFPREILPISYVVSTFISSMIGFAIVMIIIIFSNYSLNYVALSFLPIVVILVFFFVLGYVFLFSALNVYARDVQYVLSSFTIVFMFITPMYFLIDDTQGLFHTIVSINPFTYYVDAIHQCIYYGSIPDINTLAICMALSLASMLLGIFTFNKLKNGFIERL